MGEEVCPVCRAVIEPFGYRVVADGISYDRFDCADHDRRRRASRERLQSLLDQTDTDAQATSARSETAAQ